ncbi:tetratricopeptide repeat protein [Spiribacter roseus]|uniref:tetratricopeptide repeat protein n=1 Tax=Spiribacter roseus TaxID=1855875 RepID=UPI0011D0A39C
MEHSQRCIRVFLSSTFRDFSEERDLLVRQVFPALRAKLAERFVDLVDVDLRWGITEEEAERGEVLPICLSEIDRSRPFFIGLLGERYGWIPPSNAYPAEVLETQPWLEEHRGGKSVTELEILHGVLNNPDMAGRALFYFRSPAYAQSRGEGHLPVSAENEAKQQALKARIRESDFPVVEDYETPQAVADQIQHDLWEALDAEFPAADIPDAFTRDLLQHEAYAAPRRRIYLGGERYLDSLNQALKGATQWILIEGESGSGKSALLANWIDQLSSASNDLIIHTHFLGANPSAADPVALVRRLIERIRRETDTDEEPASDPDTLLDALPEWLARASAWAELNNKRFLIVLDSLNGLADRRELRWFPSMMPLRVHCVVSTLPGEVRERLDDKAQWHRIQVERLDRKTTRQVFVAYLSLFNKTLPKPLIDQVMEHPLVTNPLFLLTLAEELRLFGEHERLSEQLCYYQESKTVDDLFERVLARVEADHGAAVIRHIMTALWAARGGMREEELLAYTGLAPMKWAYIRHALGPALIETTGRYVFAHDYLRIAVSDRYMAGNNHLEDEGQSEQALKLRKQAHIWLGEWFEANAFQNDQGAVTDARAAEEIPYQWQQAKQWERLADALATLDLFMAHTEHREGYELLSYWLAIEANTRETLEVTYEHAWKKWNLDESTEEAGDVATRLRRCLSVGGRYTEFATTMARLALSLVTSRYGEQSLETVSCLNNLATLLQERGDLNSAESTQRRVIALLENRRHSNPLAYLMSLNNLGSLLWRKGEFHEAERLYREALELAVENQARHLYSKATTLNNLAALLRDRGELTDAHRLASEALAISEHCYGEHHPKTGTNLNNLGVLLKDLGNYEAAERCYRKALSVRTKTLGPAHPETSTSLNNLAEFLQDRGNLKDAETLYRRAITIRENTFGPEHFQTAMILSNLASLLRDTGDLESAERLIKKTIHIYKTNFGNNHHQTGLSLNSLAVVLQELKKYEEASRIYQRTIAVYKKTLGKSHAHTAATHQNHGVCLRTMGNYEKALKELEKALNINEQNFGPESEQAASTLSAIAKLYELTASYPKARDTYNNALTIRKKIHGTEHPKTTLIYSRLGDLNLATGQTVAAKVNFQKALRGYQRTFGPSHPTTLEVIQKLNGLN